MEYPEPNAIRVLITGFGPFYKFNENPSWLAIRPLHNIVLYTKSQPIIPRNDYDDSAIITDDMEIMHTGPLPIHITCLQIPMSYQAVLSIVPGLHARPPILPYVRDPTMLMAPTPQNGYDFFIHVALAGRGPLRFEKLAHKHGFAMKDAEGQYAPVVHLPKEVPQSAEASEMERMELHLAGEVPTPVEQHPEVEIHPVRGFGKGYENFPDEMHTDIDVAKLTLYLKEGDRPKGQESEAANGAEAEAKDPAASTEEGAAQPDGPAAQTTESLTRRYESPVQNEEVERGVEDWESQAEDFEANIVLDAENEFRKRMFLLRNRSTYFASKGNLLGKVYTSMDAGHYLCDFVFYCSLAEAKRASSKQEKSKDRDSPARSTPVLAMHCPPVDQPLATEEITEMIKKVIVRVCSQLNQ